jgi:hypothetical protein
VGSFCAVRVADVPAGGLRLLARTTLGPYGESHLFLICAATGGVRRAWSSSGAYSSERRQTPGDLHHDGVLARWARRLSWREKAGAFQTSSEAVYRSVEWGRGKRADNSLTVIYQIDAHCRRLLSVGKQRSQATLRRGLKMLGLEVVQGLRV